VYGLFCTVEKRLNVKIPANYCIFPLLCFWLYLPDTGGLISNNFPKAAQFRKRENCRTPDWN